MRRGVKRGSVVAFIVTAIGTGIFLNQGGVNVSPVPETPVDTIVADYYFDALNGSDENNGLTASTAKQTIDAFNDLTLSAGDTIAFSGTFTGAITIGQSGSAGNPIVLTSYNSSNKATVSGFTTLSGFTEGDDNMWVSDDTIPNVTRVNMVVIGGVNTPMGREPDSGYWTYTAHSGNTQITSDSLIGATDWTGAEVALNTYSYITERAAITGHNTSTGAIDFTQYEAFTIVADDMKFIIQNDSLTLDTPNEWYWNPTTKKLVVYSTTEPTNVKVASVDVLLTESGKSYVSVENIAFEGANKQAVKLDNADYAVVSYCDISFTGLDAVYGGYSGGVSDSVIIEYCTIDESNNGAVGFPYHFEKAIIRNNTISNSGMIFGSTAIYTVGTNTANLGYGICVKGEKSHIHDNSVINTGYNGIQFRNDSVIVEDNYIDGFCEILTDGGGIYTWWGDQTGDLSGIIIRNNLIMNGTVCNGIYLDDRTNNVLLYGNHIAFCETSGIYFHNNWDVTFRDNFVYNSGRGLFSWASQGATYPTTLNIKSNVVNQSVSTDYDMYMGYYQYTTVVSDSNKYVRPTTDDNIFWVNNGSTTTYDLAGWQTYSSQDANSGNAVSPVASADKFIYIFNKTTSEKDTTLSKTYYDVFGTSYSGEITLQPYTSLLLLDTD